ncbi:MAG: DNA internalization-related competence protein ComEC/Rec2 [Wenzhouxiangella sp.]|nr:MAG: DNA internalization-related competence protein ComEC/Rec2 [Wenzhouxiangella sp.]
MLWGYGLAFAGGLVLATVVPVLPPVWLVVLAALAAVMLLAWRRLLVPACLVLGACWFLLHAHWELAREWPEARAGETVRVSGTVAGLPDSRGQSLRFHLRLDRDSQQSLPGIVELSWFRPREYLQPGQRWEFEVRLFPPHGRLNPDGYDRRRQLLAEGIGATGTVAGHHRRLASRSTTGLVDRQRQYLAERLQADTTSLDAAALFRALGLADRSAMSPELGNLLRRTGTAHLLAISGLHIGMVAGLFGLLGAWLLAPLALAMPGADRRRIGVACGLVAALAYAGLAGFTLPTVRALIMLSVGGIALSLRRGMKPAHALLLAFLMVVLIDPLAPLSVGFWLSFGAVAVLIWAFAWRPGLSSTGWLKGLVLAQLVLAVGLLPLNAGIFGQAIPGALPANLFAIPMVGLWILPSLLAGLLLLLLGLPAGPALLLAEHGIGVLLVGLQWLDSAGWGYHRIASGGLLALVVAMVGAFWLLGPPGWPARWLGAFLILPLLLPRTEAVSDQALVMTVLDVGDGQAIVLESGGQRLLYDTGPGDGSGRDSISRLLPATIASTSEPVLDGVVVSRAHRGHAGGLASARDWTTGDLIRVPPGLDGLRCTADERWMLGAYTVRFLHPSAGLPDLGDNSSCVVHIEGPGGRVLLSGGIDEQVEQRLALEHPQLRADVLVLSRGGHRSSGSRAFLELVQPDLALASVARFDRFDRPHPELTGRLAEQGVALVETGRCGAVTVRLSPGLAPEISSQRGRQRRFWERGSDCP